MTKVDLDQIRAARAQRLKPAPTFMLGGVEYTCPQELPLEVITKLAAGEFTPALESLVGVDNAATIIPLLTLDDLNDLFDGLAEHYGVSLGNAAASAPSS